MSDTTNTTQSQTNNNNKPLLRKRKLQECTDSSIEEPHKKKPKLNENIENSNDKNPKISAFIQSFQRQKTELLTTKTKLRSTKTKLNKTTAAMQHYKKGMGLYKKTMTDWKQKYFDLVSQINAKKTDTNTNTNTQTNATNPTIDAMSMNEISESDSDIHILSNPDTNNRILTKNSNTNNGTKESKTNAIEPIKDINSLSNTLLEYGFSTADVSNAIRTYNKPGIDGKTLLHSALNSLLYPDTNKHSQTVTDNRAIRKKIAKKTNKTDIKRKKRVNIHKNMSDSESDHETEQRKKRKRRVKSKSKTKPNKDCGVFEESYSVSIECHICEKEFDGLNKFETHLNGHYSSDETKVWGICPFCDKSMDKYFGNHILKHTKQRKYKCKVCVSEFNAEVLIKAHWKSQHSKKQKSKTKIRKLNTNKNKGRHRRKSNRGKGSNTK